MNQTIDQTVEPIQTVQELIDILKIFSEGRDASSMYINTSEESSASFSVALTEEILSDGSKVVDICIDQIDELDVDFSERAA